MTIVGLVAAVTVLAATALVHNQLVGLRNKTHYTWADCDAVLTRRAQTIPRLVDVVQGAMAHERTVFEVVATARAGTQSVAANGPSEARFEAERRLGAASASLVAVAEAYPELRAQEAAADLIEALKDIEGDLRRARMVYNRTVQTYEDARQALPSSLVAGAFRFGPLPYFSD